MEFFTLILVGIVVVRARNCEVVVYTTREQSVVSKWLKENGFPPLPIYNEKPLAHVYVDDRALQFRGVWTDECVEAAITFKTYWEKAKEAGQ
jgi:hypothetical protein